MEQQTHLPLPEGQRQIRERIRDLDKDLSDWLQLKKQILDDPVCQHFNPVDDALRNQFYGMRRSMLLAREQLLLVGHLLDAVSEN